MTNESENNAADLKKILSVAVGKVDKKKLEQLEQKLELALGRPLASHVLDDPIVIRRCLIEHLRSEGTTPGIVEAQVQFFMGIVRRAALEGLIPAPPEGPWTRLWQSVLDDSANVSSTKSLFRSLAAWATARHLDPGGVDLDHLKTWARDVMIKDETVLVVVQRVLNNWSPISASASLASDDFLVDRLRKKALEGTVRPRTADKQSTS